MSEMVAYCGLLCNECLAYKATVADDMALREETAAQWRISTVWGAIPTCFSVTATCAR
jgi:hypothetical protein